MVPLLEHREYCLFPSASCFISFAPRAWESGSFSRLGEPLLLRCPLMKVLLKPRAPCCETVVAVLLGAAEQLAMHLGLLLEGCTQGLAPCLFLFFVFFFSFPKAAENRRVAFVLRGEKRTRDFANSYEKSRIGPFWNLPTLTVSL